MVSNPTSRQELVVEWPSSVGVVAARNGRSCSFDCRRAIEGTF
jgi:hypothetical protein